MTQAIAALSSQSRFGMREAGLWTSAAAIILAAHVAVAYAVQNLSFADMPDGGPPPALTVDMAPLVSAPPVPEDSAMLDTISPIPPNAAEETPVDPKPVTDPPPDPVTDEAEPVTDPPVDPDTAEQAEPTEQTLALSEQQPLDEVVPDPVEAISPDVVVPLPEPRPVEKVDKPVEAKKKPVEKPKQRPKKEKAPAPKASMTASIDAKAEAKAAAPKSTGASRSGDSSRWNSSLAAWIKRHTRYPNAARPRRAEGTANVTFVVDASGSVSSVRLARSSGDADLDRAALGALQGATVPAPPPEKAGKRVTAPLYFNLRD